MTAMEWQYARTFRAYNKWRYTDETRSVIEVKLSDEHRCFFDAEHKDVVLKRKWFALRKRNVWYAEARKGSKMVYMHRIILALTDIDQIVDHIDGNGLNNVLTNLSVGTEKENGNNNKMNVTNTTGYNGISMYKKNPAWRVHWKEDTRPKDKFFSFGPRSSMNQQQALDAAIVFRDAVYERIGNKNGIRPK